MNQQPQKLNEMFNKKIVRKVLQQTWALDGNPGYDPNKLSDDQSSVVSQLIYDIFGGEILKTNKKKSWHFYNRINGERIDLALSETEKTYPYSHFQDLTSTPEEIHNYFAQEDYSTFYMKFISVFEEVIGLNKNRYKSAV